MARPTLEVALLRVQDNQPTLADTRVLLEEIVRSHAFRTRCRDIGCLLETSKRLEDRHEENAMLLGELLLVAHRPLDEAPGDATTFRALSPAFTTHLNKRRQLAVLRTGAWKHHLRIRFESQSDNVLSVSDALAEALGAVEALWNVPNTLVHQIVSGLTPQSSP